MLFNGSRAIPNGAHSVLKVAGQLLRYAGAMGAALSAITMPSKTQSIIASHTPIVCSAPGDVAAVVAKNDIGLVCPPGDVEKLKDCL